MKPLIQLKNVSVIYDKGQVNEMVALKDINAEIYEGEYIVFFGPSGCGKSTLLYTIAGLEQAASGEVLVDGKDLRTITLEDKIEFYRTTIGMVFQAFYLVSHLTAKDNLVLSQMFSGVMPEEREAKAVELMDKFGITSFADHRPSMMSGGQQQRTAIARALMSDPLIVLADEPVGNLDSKNAEIVLKLLADIHSNEKKTVIQVTHNPKDIHYADRVFYMKDGRIEQIVANTEKGKKIESRTEEADSEIAKLSRAHPEMNDSQLLATHMMRHILYPYDIETELKITKAIEQFIKKEINEKEFQRLLDEGAGLYSQKATHIVREVEKLMVEVNKMANPAQVSSAQSTGNEAREEELIHYLLESYRGHATQEQIARMKKLIDDRIKGAISHDELKELLDKPLKEGGVGLNVRTARKFAEEIDFMLNKN